MYSNITDEIALFDGPLYDPSQIQNGQILNAAGPGAGMKNLGNSCYMAAILQALFHTPSFSNWANSHLCNDGDKHDGIFFWPEITVSLTLSFPM